MKKELRKQTLARRLKLTAAERSEKSRTITQRTKSLAAYGQARTVMLYLDFRGEVETTGLVQDALSSGKRIAVPVCNPDRTITPKEIHNLEQDLQIGTWGIREPRPDQCQPVDPLEIDLVLVPGVAFDSKGNRLGYGAGYYDRFVLRLRPETPLVALAFEAQILPEIQPDPHDRPMHMVVTENRVIAVNKREVCR